MTITTNPFNIPSVFNPTNDGYPRGNNRIVLLGPPGCGKTRAVLDAFIEPAMSLGVGADEILSCSFTRAAAKELRTRLSKSTGLPNGRLLETCSTIHAEALRRFRKMFVGQKFVILGEKKNYEEDEDEGPASRFLEEAMPEGFDIKDTVAVQLWNLARNKLITDVESQAFLRIVEEFNVKKSISEIKGWIYSYENKKKLGRMLDFTDILLKGLQCPAPSRKLLIVDEAQDCSLLQWKLVEKWATSAGHVALIGDFDQCLYSYNGAYPERIFTLIKDGFISRRLGQSYRVPSKVHKIARALIVKNKNRIDAPYEPMNKVGEADELSASMALEELERAHKDNKDTFVLARGAKILEFWSESLSLKGIPFYNERGKSPWGSAIAVAVVKAVMSIRENRPLNTSDAVRLVEQFPGRHNEFFNKGITKKASVLALKAKVEATISALDLEELGLKLDFIRVADLEALLKELDLKDRATTMALIVQKNGSKVFDKEPKIRLTTMHGSKGREADVVVVDMEAPKATIISVSKNKDTIESERRLCYVAFTRTKNTLIIVRKGYDLGVITGMPKVQ